MTRRRSPCWTGSTSTPSPGATPSQSNRCTKVITDTLTIDVFGPGDIIIKQDVSQVVLKPGQVLRYTVEIPAELGKPTGLRLTLDDP